jgi:hypothetical protein
MVVMELIIIKDGLYDNSDLCGGLLS